MHASIHANMAAVRVSTPRSTLQYFRVSILQLNAPFAVALSCGKLICVRLLPASLQILDIVEGHNASTRILDFHVGKDRTTPTELRLQIFTSNTHAATSPAMLAILKEVHSIATSAGVAISVDSEDSHLHHAGAAALMKRVKSIAAPMKRILVLGAGFVSGPVVEYLLRRPANHITVASMLKEESQHLSKGRTRVQPVQLDVFKVRVVRREATMLV